MIEIEQLIRLVRRGKLKQLDAGVKLIQGERVATTLVRYAVKTGQLIKTACARCNNEKVYAHHDSYDEPLNVMWLCQPCHKQRHKELDSMGIKP